MDGQPEGFPGNGFEPDLDAWDAWRPDEVARRFAGIDAPWYVAGGWSIDLFLGGQRREHEDLEVAVPRDRFEAFVPALAGCDFFVVGDGLAWPLSRESAAAHHQTWVRENRTGRWRLDIFREPAEGDIWISRRDDRIRMPYQELILHTDDGIPYSRPEVTLFFKAKAARPVDLDDFAAALPHLSSQSRRWLIDALETVHPGHGWIERLRDG